MSGRDAPLRRDRGANAGDLVRAAEARVLVTRRGAPLADDSVPVTFVITDETTGVTARTSDHFMGPHK